MSTFRPNCIELFFLLYQQSFALSNFNFSHPGYETKCNKASAIYPMWIIKLFKLIFECIDCMIIFDYKRNPDV